MNNQLDVVDHDTTLLHTHSLSENPRLKIDSFAEIPLNDDLTKKLLLAVEELNPSYTLVVKDVYKSNGVSVTLELTSGKKLNMGLGSRIIVPGSTTPEQMTNRVVLWHAMKIAGFVFCHHNWQRFMLLIGETNN